MKFNGKTLGSYIMQDKMTVNVALPDWTLAQPR